MRLIPSDPDIRTVFSRIQDGSLDLQPDFQRGEVWSQPKQKLLIDSVLRNWYVPPIHLVRVDEDEQVVLDGQQRLRAIELFMRNRFAVSGNTEPTDPAIQRLHGLRYDQLPEAVRRRFDRFTLRLFELVDYEPDEPSELFFRLNQPATLTEAEKRNAFFGPARQQVRELTGIAERNGMESDRIGFSSARLAYEDVIARFVWTLEVNNLGEKVTASRVTARYRSHAPLPANVMDFAERALVQVFSTPALNEQSVRLNKATAHSWLLFAARSAAGASGDPGFDAYFEWFEKARSSQRESAARETRDVDSLIVEVFNDRATARVNDVSSVLLRDAALWALRYRHGDSPLEDAEKLWDAFALSEGVGTVESHVVRAAGELDWMTLR